MHGPLVLATGVVLLAGALVLAADPAPQRSGFEIAVAGDGSLQLPDVDFRTEWTMLGSWAVDGWGWGFFAAADPSVLVTEDYVLECKACHVPAEATDWVYTRAYPALRSDEPTSAAR